MANRYIDISVAISEAIPVWPGDPGVQIKPSSRIDQGDQANVSRLEFGTHTGTHLDPPYHFLPDGKKEDQLPFGPMMGHCWVADLTAIQQNITGADLDKAEIPEGTTRLLLKTRNSRHWANQTPDSDFDEDFTALTPDASQWIVDHGIQLVGIDYLSVEPYKGDDDTHRILLRAGVIPVETLDLHAVEPGGYTLVCLPIKIKDGDGGPCRAILIPED